MFRSTFASLHVWHQPSSIFIELCLPSWKILLCTMKRHDRANDNGNFNWMNTLLTIIKGSAFSQYLVVDVVIWCPLFIVTYTQSVPVYLFSPCSLLLMLLDPNNFKGTQNKKMNIHCMKKATSLFFLCSSPEKIFFIRQCWINLCCFILFYFSFVSHSEWEKVSFNRWNRQLQTSCSQSETNVVLLCFLFSPFFILSVRSFDFMRF